MSMPTYEYELEQLVLGDLLQKKAAAYGGETFLKFREGELSYGEVNAISDRMARGLADQGIRQNDHVAVMLPNSAEFLYVTFALAKLGAVVVPINTAYRGEILHHVIKTSDVSMLIVDEPLMDAVAEVDARPTKLSSVIVRMHTTSGESLRGLQRQTLPLSRLMESRAEPPKVTVRHCDLQGIMYTSGTTGPSKGVITLHAHALTCALDSLHFLAYEPGETIYCPLPLFHAGSLWDGVMTALLGDLSIAIVERFSASRFWDDVRHFRANVAMGIFSMIPILMKKPPAPEDKDHPLRAFYLGKSILSEAFRQRFGVQSVETYTSTEVGIATGSPYGQWRPGSCGQANEATYEVKIFDELDSEKGAGEPGELVVRPRRPFVITPGYYNFPKATIEALRNLWFHTGDRAYRDEDGYFYFLERIKESIRRRGENISAFEVEQAINSHPLVLECAAFGVPSEVEEEELKIAVVLQERAALDPAELAAYSQGRLPSFMVPRYIEFVDELPKTPIGKIARHELQRQGNHGITSRTWDRERAGKSTV